MTDSQEKPSRHGLTMGPSLLVVIVLIVSIIGWRIQTGGAAQLAAGETAISTGNWNEALNQLNDAVVIQPAFLQTRPAEAIGLRGVAQYQLGNLEAALADLDTALAQDENLWDLYGYRALIHYQQGNTDLFLSDSEQALSQANLLTAAIAATLQAHRAIVLSETSPDTVLPHLEAALAQKAYLTDTQLSQLWATQALATFATNQTETAVTLARSALATESGLPETTRGQLYTHLAATYQTNGDETAAWDATTEALKYTETLPHETAAQLHEIRAILAFKRGDIETAIAQAQQAENYSSHSSQLLALQAHQQMTQFDWPTALETANAALDLDAENSLAYFVRGTLLTWRGDYNNALADLQQTVALNPQDTEAIATQAFIAYFQEAPEQLATLTQAAQAIAPGSPATLWARALEHLHHGRLEEANFLMDLAIELDNNRPEFYLTRSFTYRLTNDEPETLVDLEQALNLNPDFTHAQLTYLGERISRSKFHEISEQEIQEFIEQYPNWPLPYDVLAAYYAWQEDVEQTRAAIDNAIALAPSVPSRYTWRARLHILDGDIEAAQADIDQALALDPHNYEVFAVQALLASEEENWEEALAYREQIQAQRPNNIFNQIQQARYLYASGQINEAWQLLGKVLTIDPNDPDALLIRSTLWAKSDDYIAALADASRVVEIEPDDYFSYENRAALYLLIDELENARADAEKAIELDNKNALDAYRVLAIIAWLEEDANTAITQIDEMVAQADEKNARLYEIQSFIYLNNDRAQEIIDPLTEGIEALSDQENIATLYFNRALAYRTIGDPDKATSDLEEALALAEEINTIADIEVELANDAPIEQVADGLVTVTDTNLGYTIRYPSTWTSVPPNTDVGQRLLLEKETDEGNAVFILVIAELPLETSSQMIFDAIIANLNTVTGFSQLSTGVVQVAGQESLYHDYRLEVSEFVIARGRQYMFVTNGLGIVLSYETIEADFELIQEELESIVNSFQLLE